jgi:hypothetical protein
LWRVFPWDRTAAPGDPYSAASVAPREKQGGGRFDLPELTSVLYLAETPEHGYAEFLQDFRTQILTRAHLKRNQRPLAHVSVEVPLETFHSLPDLADPDTLRHYDIRPDILSLPRPHRRTTQASTSDLGRRPGGVALVVRVSWRVAHHRAVHGARSRRSTTTSALQQPPPSWPGATSSRRS